MDAADKLERERATHPRRFALWGWWLAFRGNMMPGILIVLVAGFIAAGTALVSWVNLLTTGANAVSVLIPAFALTAISFTLWILGTGRFKPKTGGIVALCAGGFGLIVITIILGVATGIDKASGEIFSLTIWTMVMAGGMFGIVATKLPSVFGLDQGVVGKTLDITSTSSPRLHALVSETARSLGLPTPSRILLAQQTSLAQHIEIHRREGNITELRMGINDIGNLDESELKAVIAHELEHQGHSSLRIRALISAIHRLRAGKLNASQMRLVEEMELHACVTLREDERKSDRASAKVDAPRAASALTRIVVQGIVNDNVFANPDRLVCRAPEPPATIEALNALIESQAWYPSLLQTCRATALLSVTLPGSTHPMLSDRLRAMGQHAPTDLSRPKTTAAALLDEAGADFLRRHHESWRVNARDAWMKSHARLMADEALLQDPANSQLENLNDAQLRKRATDLWLLRGSKEALPALEAYRERMPEDSWAIYWTAMAKADLGIQEGADELVALARNDPGQAEGLRYAAVHAFLKGNEAEAREIWCDMLRLRDLETKNRLERETLVDTDAALEHNLGAPELPLLVGTLADHGVIRSAHLVRRKLSHIQKPDQHVVVLTFWNGPDGRYERGHAEHRKEATQAVLKIFQDTKHQFWVLPAENFPRLAKAAKAITGSKLK